MRKLHVILSIAALAAAPLALGQTQDKVFTPQGNPPDTDWFDPLNWGPQTGVPGLTNDVLIPEGTFCVIADSASIATAKSVEVEDGGQLHVIDGQTLHVRNSANPAYPSLKVDGLLGMYDEEQTLTAILLLEQRGPRVGPRVAEVTGAGDVFGSPAEFAWSMGTAMATVVHIDDAVTVAGTWDIPLNIDNDGTITAPTSHTIRFIYSDPPECDSPWYVSGAGTFSVTGSGALMQFQDVYFTDFRPHLVVSNGRMEFLNVCSALPTAPGIEEGGSITVSGGFLDFDYGLVFTGDGTAAVDLEVSGGIFSSWAEIDLVTINAELSGGFFDVPTNVELRSGGSLLVEGDVEFFTPYLHTNQPQPYSLTVDGGTLECDYFKFSDMTLSVESGLFLVNGESEKDSEATSSNTLTISGGQMQVGGGYSGDSSTDLTILGGTLQILESEEDDVFQNVGEFFYSAGTIRVKQGEKIVIR
jgi:hypothetical protein